LLGLLALAAIGGAIAAFLLTRDNGQPASAQGKTVVVNHTSQGRTVQQTVTVATTAPAATNPPAPPPAPPPPSVAATPSLSQARRLVDNSTYKIRAGDYAGALPIAQQALGALSGSGDVFEAYANFNVGYALLQLGRCSEAIGYLKTAQRLEPGRPEPKDAAKRARDCSKG
jgi:tetratricopeptide (TPR) repeat protein